MLTEGIIRARFNVSSNVLVCVVSRYSYSMVFTMEHCLSCIEAAHAITYMNELTMLACNL